MRAPGRSAQGRVERQRILDYLWAHGSSCASRIAEGTGTEYRQTLRRAVRMRALGELAAETRVEGNKKIRYFAPLALLTVTQLPALPAAPRPKHAAVASTQNNVDTLAPGYVRHNGTQRDHPLPRQGGQGPVTGPLSSTYLETKLWKL